MSFQDFKIFTNESAGPIIKICGLQTVEAARRALDAGANMIGIICVPNRKRTVDPNIAKQISAMIHGDARYEGRYLVGVFRNQSIEEVSRICLLYTSRCV